MSTTLFCGSCGNQMPAAARFCGTCGEAQEPIAAVAAPAGARPRVAADPPPPPPRHEPPPPLPDVAAPARAPYEDLPPPPRRREPAPRERFDPPPPLMPRDRYDAPAPSGAPRQLPLAAHPAYGQAVPATLGKRLGAVVLDGLLYLALLLVVGAPFLIGAPDALMVVILIPGLIALTLLPTFLLARQGPNNGQSLGKQLVGIRVISLDGGPMTIGRAASRELLWKWLIIGFIGGFLIIPSLLNLIWPLFDERHRALHDKAARTLVVPA